MKNLIHLHFTHFHHRIIHNLNPAPDLLIEKIGRIIIWIILINTNLHYVHTQPKPQQNQNRKRRQGRGGRREKWNWPPCLTIILSKKNAEQPQDWDKMRSWSGQPNIERFVCRSAACVSATSFCYIAVETRKGPCRARAASSAEGGSTFADELLQATYLIFFS